MLALTVTRSRVARALTDAAEVLQRDGWDPRRFSVIAAIDQAAGYTPGSNDPAAEETTLQAWDALATYLGEQPVEVWERDPARTQAEVVAAVRGAARQLLPHHPRTAPRRERCHHA